ncbi:D-inositol-3-phosphate glycosyltransferase [Sciscionella marina]|uniref:D-inositol-3-phosphate glycosyltransferase n=1 Tax=Sciscionella marina TaxID=508770 RepID=UPI0003792E8B|nr:D-inositol-3-phosphate glycosyltransferase [Sciscionella marina]
MSSAYPRRVGVLSMHTSPLEQPGTGDAGGLNVYVRQTATRMARRGIAVEVFTRANSANLPPIAELAPGVTVRHVPAGGFDGLAKEQLPAQLQAFAEGVLDSRAEPFDVLHSHYWLSGKAGLLARRRWRVPLVHNAHTLAKVKNEQRAEGESAEPKVRVDGEQTLAEGADRLVANTEVEAAQLERLYGVAADRIAVVAPGVDLDVFTPGGRDRARAELDIAPDTLVLGFVGRIQPLKAPDVLLRAAAALVRETPSLAEKLLVLIVGGPSGSGRAMPAQLRELSRTLGIDHLTRFAAPRAGAALATVYRAADVLAVPSYNESFGLVALEAQACGTPVVAARVGGLPIAVADGSTGLLVDGHAVQRWSAALAKLLTEPALRGRYALDCVRHAARFSWERTTDALLRGYRAALGSATDLRTPA